MKPAPRKPTQAKRAEKRQKANVLPRRGDLSKQLQHEIEAHKLARINCDEWIGIACKTQQESNGRLAQIGELMRAEQQLRSDKAELAQRVLDLTTERDSALAELSHAETYYQKKFIDAAAERDKAQYERFGYQGKAIELADELNDERAATRFLARKLTYIGYDYYLALSRIEHKTEHLKAAKSRATLWRNSFFILAALLLLGLCAAGWAVRHG